MLVQTKELFRKTLVFSAMTAGCGILGFFIPLFFDRDVGGAMAAAILGIVGLVVGAAAGLFVIRRNFD